MNQAPLHTAHPVFNRPGWASRLAAAFAAVLTSSALLGSVLFMFDQQSGDASLARASAPDAPASGALAVRGTGRGPRT
jgi:hypothetical protein